MQEIGLEARTGVHVGELGVAGGKPVGLAVHVAARIAALAEPGETLVSSTARDLVSGSGLGFSERGTHELKGVPDPWRVFALQG